MWGAIIGILLMAPAKATVEKLEALNQKEEIVELEKYEAQLVREYGIKEPLKMGSVFDYSGYMKQAKKDRLHLGN